MTELQITIVGGGRMGAGIAHAFLASGAAVALVEVDDSTANLARERVIQELRVASTRGFLAQDPDEIAVRLTAHDEPNNPVVAEYAKPVNAAPDDSLHGYDMVLTIIAKDGAEKVIETPGDRPQWLLTWDEVLDSLREKFRQGGLGLERLEAVAAAVPGALDGRGLAPLLRALGA